MKNLLNRQIIVSFLCGITLCLLVLDRYHKDILQTTAICWVNQNGRKRSILNDVQTGNKSRGDKKQRKPSQKPDPKCDDEFEAWLSKNKKRAKEAEVERYKENCGQKSTCKHKSKLWGPVLVDDTDVQLDYLKKHELSFVEKGGWWMSTNCKPKTHVAIIVPYRDRTSHLPIFLRQLLPILKRKDDYHFRIFLIEQDDQHTFNRGKLLNVGFMEAQTFFPFSCFVFHDIDLLPENDKIHYGCEQSPMHLSVAVSTLQYTLPYSTIFGGVEMLTKNHYDELNGFSNSFWYWGGEDDNLSYRLREVHGMAIHRQSSRTARFSMISHEQSKTIKNLGERREYLRRSKNYCKDDGLNTLQYEVKEVVEEDLYTIIRVDLHKERDKEFGILHQYSKD